MPPAITEINYKLHLFTDLHIGSGVGLPGVIDEYVVRDSEGFAYAPSSEIKGIVKDNCIRLMKYLDCCKKLHNACLGQREQIKGDAPPAQKFCALAGNKTCALCAIFGSQITPGSWWFSPAQYTDKYRKSIQKFENDGMPGRSKQLTRRDSATSAHTAIDPFTRRSAEGNLFNLEVVRLPDSSDSLREFALWEGRIVLQAPLPGNKEPDLAHDELLGWLLASLLFTRRIGGRRRRGWGRCRFVLSGDNKSALEQQLEAWLICRQTEGDLHAGG